MGARKKVSEKERENARERVREREGERVQERAQGRVQVRESASLRFDSSWNLCDARQKGKAGAFSE